MTWVLSDSGKSGFIHMHSENVQNAWLLLFESFSSDGKELKICLVSRFALPHLARSIDEIDVNRQFIHSTFVLSKSNTFETCT